MDFSVKAYKRRMVGLQFLNCLCRWKALRCYRPLWRYCSLASNIRIRGTTAAPTVTRFPFKRFRLRKKSGQYISRLVFPYTLFLCGQIASEKNRCSVPDFFSLAIFVFCDFWRHYGDSGRGIPGGVFLFSLLWKRWQKEQTHETFLFL